ncbi:MAG: hypothetical protein A2W91_11295 [Bacteroidetes bacterium GWF2_38_335]|nr:MAG: hypothetical protein A2W91_11295 [Bacteroidetes bacterium GWF2_38_335]OFY81718.1 MAG: hypothetical protein A2281_05745 [Bacteroidetes bacterium RIFOXYA12_FULL_38_20]HBS87782.1 hypothetical protein [Bacteroidales bacterium]
MKKGAITLIVTGIVLLSCGLLIYSESNNLSNVDLVQFGVIALVVVFAVYFGMKRINSSRRGEPVEDEMSKKMVQKTAALSYYISLYIWVAMIFIKDRVEMDTEELLGTGIIGMAITFALCWVFFNFRGIRNE